MSESGWGGVGLRCPQCRRPLEVEEASLRCEGCGGGYPIVAGIADLRTAPDPYISLEADREKARLLAERARWSTFRELLEFYYAMTPEVPRELAERYMAHHLAGVERGRAVLRRHDAYFPTAGGWAGHRVLDLGCGSGGLVAVAAAAGAQAMGIDVALRWLVIGRRRLEELGAGDAVLVCACAERLPLADGSFDVVFAEGLLEHLPDASVALSEARRVGRGGRLVARSVNRFVLGPEPHVGLWGIGFLPRTWARAWVRWRRGLDYGKVHLRSAGELRRLLRRGAYREVRVRAPLLSSTEIRHQASLRRRLLTLYLLLAKVPGLRRIVLPFAPFIDLVGELGAAPASGVDE